MKSLFVLLVLAIIAMTSAKPQECIYVEGRCASYCEEGTHSYTTGCDRVLPEATCDVPNPVLEEGDTCDFTACYCNPPTVRDTVSGKCVSLNKCPKKQTESSILQTTIKTNEI